MKKTILTLPEGIDDFNNMKLKTAKEQHWEGKIDFVFRRGTIVAMLEHY